MGGFLENLILHVCLPPLRGENRKRGSERETMVASLVSLEKLGLMKPLGGSLAVFESVCVRVRARERERDMHILSPCTDGATFIRLQKYMSGIIKAHL